MKLNWAERWAVNNPFRPLQQRLEIGWMKRRGALKGGAVALEIGCGRGAGAAILHREFGPAALQAMDLDLEMIRKARAYLSPGQRRRISLFVGDVLRLPYRDEALDAVFGFGVLHHLPDWQGGLAEIARVLKPGGVYFLEELYPSLYQNFLTRRILLHPAANRFRGAELKTALQAAGLRLDHRIERSWAGILGVAIKSSGQEGEGLCVPSPDGTQSRVG